MNAYAASSRKKNHPIIHGKVRSLSQRGFGIIEIGIVLVIVSMMLAVTLGYVRGVLADNRANDEAKDLPQIILHIQRLYNNRSTYAGATAQGLIGNGVFPRDRTINGNPPASVSNRWGGTVTPALLAAGLVNANDAITLTYTNVPQLECNSLITQVERSAARIAAGPAAAPAVVKAFAAAGGVLDINGLGIACAAGGVANTLVFTIPVTQ